MSTNRKNQQVKAVLRSWVRNQFIQQRSVLDIEERLLDSSDISRIVDEINAEIQEINRSLEGRNVPYITIEKSRNLYDFDKTRVLLRSERSDISNKDDIKIAIETSRENTFLVEFYLNDNGYVEVGYEEETKLVPVNANNFILIDCEDVACALADVFLDSAMFNSYSFLRKLPPNRKRNINRYKVDFLKRRYGKFTEYDSPFYIFNSDDYEYLSMAFFTRRSKKNTNLQELIDIWEEFVHDCFPMERHEEPPVLEQLNSLVDLEQYSNKIKKQCCELEKGTYWVLRIHKAPVNEDVEKWLAAVFGKAEIGEEKIVSFRDFASVFELVKHQHIAAFKIVIS